MGKQEKRQAQASAYADMVMSFLDEEARAAIDKVGYGLLAKHGFDVEDAESSVAVRFRLAREMEKKRMSLQYYAIPDESDHSNVIYFELVVNGRVRDKSGGVRISYRDKEGADGEEKARDDTQGAS